MNMDSSISLKTKGRQTDTIVVIGGTVSCHVTTYGATSDDNVVFLYEHNVRSTTPVQYNPLGIINQLDISFFTRFGLIRTRPFLHEYCKDWMSTTRYIIN